MSYLGLFFFHDTATTVIYTDLHTLSLHDALPICSMRKARSNASRRSPRSTARASTACPSTKARSRWSAPTPLRSEEHTSELQSLMRLSYAVFCLKKKNNKKTYKHKSSPHTQTHRLSYP